MNEKLKKAKEIIASQHGFKSWKGIMINLPSLNSDKIISQVAERYHELMDEWISVDDRLPENTGWYQVFTNDEFILTAKVAANGWWTIPFGAYYGDMGDNFVKDSKEVEREVTHWKPLPTPPKQQL